MGIYSPEIRQETAHVPTTQALRPTGKWKSRQEAGAGPGLQLRGLCDKPAFHDGRKDVVTDATLVAEVLSPSTEGYDRGGKFALYRGLPGLRQYLVIAQDRPAIDVFTRQPDGRWVLEADADPDAAIPLDSIGCTLTLGEVYAKVEFEPAPTPTGARPAL